MSGTIGTSTPRTCAYTRIASIKIITAPKKPAITAIIFSKLYNANAAISTAGITMFLRKATISAKCKMPQRLSQS